MSDEKKPNCLCMQDGWEDGTWEDLGKSTDRMCVPGGWIYKEVSWSSVGRDDVPDSVSVALCFVPCPHPEYLEGDSPAEPPPARKP